MDNEYFTEKIAPKNKPAEGSAEGAKPRSDRPRRDRNGGRPHRRNDAPRAEHRNDPAVPESIEKVEIIGVRFKDVGKVYYFSPCGISFRHGDKVIVETARGVECGDIVLANRKISEKSLVSPLKKVLRKADENDILQAQKNREKEKEIMKTF